MGIVKGFVGLQGIYDVRALVESHPTYEDWFVRPALGPATPPDEDPTASTWAAASPVRYARLAPGLEHAAHLIVHSPEDELVEVDQSLAWARRLSELGATQVEVVDDAARIGGSHDGMLEKREFFELVKAWIAKQVSV
ncbi:hypothetical protein DFJ73DRAFT_851820 [Zopfochytrium polystomum]|nr:hypothetical protein DFJ73DRAFT_851820 [Zopfochytrium polystomum]